MTTGRTCAHCSEPATHGVLCEKHKQKSQENNRKRSAHKRASGECWDCSDKALEGMKLCLIHLEARRESNAANRRKKKLPDCPHCNGTGKLDQADTK